MLCRHPERERIFGQSGGRKSLISCKSETAPPLQIYDRSPGRHFANPRLTSLRGEHRRCPESLARSYQSI